MSRVEDALRRIRNEGSARAPAPPGEAGAERQPTPGGEAGTERQPASSGSRRKVTVSGEKHHVSEEELIRGGMLAPLDRAAPVADEFRRIKRPLIANAVKGPEAGERMNVIMITSAMPGAGKTFSAVNLAMSLSLERELNVLLVDADVAKPHISRGFGLGNAAGLLDLLSDESLDLADLLVRTDLNDIQVLPAGSRHEQATELLASERMATIVRELAERYPDRIIVVDSPPLLVTSEAQALAGHVGQIALVVEAGKTSQHALQQAIETLDPDKATNLILNKSRHSGRLGYYGDYGYYGQEPS